MTLIVVYRARHSQRLIALADSRLTSNGLVVTDRAPKFAIAHVRCYRPGKENLDLPPVLDHPIAFGYTGSSMIALPTIATLQAYLSSLKIKPEQRTPSLENVAELARVVLDGNFREFGVRFPSAEGCDLIICGQLPYDLMRVFHLSAAVVDGVAMTRVNELLCEVGIVWSFGSARKYFRDRLDAEVSQGRFQPIVLLGKLLAEGERSDIGGYLQAAMVTPDEAFLPNLITPQPQLGEGRADITYLGRDLSEFPRVGDCEIGRWAFTDEIEDTKTRTFRVHNAPD